MPDIGMFELILIGVVAFVVLGPERLPDFFRQISGFVRQARSWIDEVRSQWTEEVDQLSAPVKETGQIVGQEIKRALDDKGESSKSKTK